MERQFFGLKSSKTQEPCLAVAMAKKVLNDNKVALVAYGYEGGGCWSDYYAVYKLDEYMEGVEEIIESWVGGPDEPSDYLDDYEELNDYISKFCDFDEDGVPILKEECLTDAEYDSETGQYDHEWDWDDGVHFAASDDWQFHARWSEE